jgi:hypothetical protein
MNQKPTGVRAARLQAEREDTLKALGPLSGKDKATWQTIRAELSQTRREAKLPIEPNLPDLWSYDSARLLSELDGIREMILRIPATPDTRSALQSAIDRIWRVEQDTRFLLSLQRDGQRAFAKRAEIKQPRTRQRAAVNERKIVSIRA